MPHRVTEAGAAAAAGGSKPTAGQKAGAATGSGGAHGGAMSGGTSVRRQSFIDHGPGTGVGAHGGQPGAGVSGLHSGSRAAFIMTSSSAHSRRISVPGLPPHSALSRHYENSYKTEPEQTFSTSTAKRVIRDVMESILDGKEYDTETCKQLTVTLADAIKKRVKELGFSRYKIVTNVAIGQASENSVAFASRCVWNVNFDSFAEYTYKNSSLFAVGLVYAIYSE